MPKRSERHARAARRNLVTARGYRKLTGRSLRRGR